VRSQGCDVVAPGDEIPQAVAATQAALSLPDVTTFTDAATMASALTGRIDAAIVASHTCDHARHSAPFIAAGIPVYLEKPITDDLTDAFEFCAALDPHEPGVQLGLQRRFDPALLHARSILHDGLLGDIREIRSILRDQFPPPSTYKSRGLIIDMGIHVADEIRFLLDDFPAEIWASVHHTPGYESPIDGGGDTAYVTMRFASGALGRLDLSRTHASGYNNETYIIGTNGTLHIGRFAGYPGPIHVELWTPAGNLHPISRSFEMTDLTRPYPEFLPRFQQAYLDAHTAFRAAISVRRAFTVSPIDALDAQVIVEAAHRSAADNRRSVTIRRSADLGHYRAACAAAGLLDT